MCVRERVCMCVCGGGECVHVCVRRGGIHGNLLEGITSVLQLASFWSGGRRGMGWGSGMEERERQLASEYK